MIDRLLSALKRVRAKGDGASWMASCPVHAEKTPSLSIKLEQDGTMLMHCFGCCANGVQVAEALGIPVSDLFPPHPHDTPGRRGPYTGNTRNVLAAAAHEALIVVIAMEDVWRGEDLSPSDKDRVFEAVLRLRELAS